MTTGTTVNIAAIILAAGESKRMGRPKMLLPFRGRTIIETVVKNIKDSGIENILAVTGAEREITANLLNQNSVNFCINNNYREGMLSSVICGIRNISGDPEAIFIFPGDQPLISPVTIKSMISNYRTSEFGIFIPVFKGRRGHPLLIDRHYMMEVEKLNTEEGLRALAIMHPDDVSEVETNDPGILKDFDTYDDYLREINQIS
ncbi:MAG TPA: nucleotidyltransferase family protein [Bacteroidales bacterium]|nr:nucleotidyltransferase family protein [Bacteroidales bacterium]